MSEYSIVEYNITQPTVEYIINALYPQFKQNILGYIKDKV